MPKKFTSHTLFLVAIARSLAILLYLKYFNAPDKLRFWNWQI